MKKNLLIWILTIAIILPLLFYVLKDINLVQIYELLKQIKINYFLIAVLCYFIGLLLWNLRFTKSVRYVVNGDYWFMLSVLLSGTFFNSITPGQNVGGEPIRAYFIGKKYKKSKTKILGVILADKLMNLFVYSLFLIFSILFVLTFLSISTKMKLILEICLISVIILIGIVTYFVHSNKKINLDILLKLIYNFGFERYFKTREEFLSYFNKMINGFIKSFKKVLRDKKLFRAGLIISLVYWISNFLISYLLFLSFDYKINFLSIVIVFTLGYFAGELSPIPGGIGIVETAMLLLYSAMGIPLELAILVTLLSRVIHYIFSYIIGGLCFLYLKLKY
ncbi:MAG: lysylphosphatidylglycerol synthase transmembrane domain-containing protein [Nanoarchaeota archaeon]